MLNWLWHKITQKGLIFCKTNQPINWVFCWMQKTCKKSIKWIYMFSWNSVDYWILMWRDKIAVKKVPHCYWLLVIRTGSWEEINTNIICCIYFIKSFFHKARKFGCKSEIALLHICYFLICYKVKKLSEPLLNVGSPKFSLEHVELISFHYTFYFLLLHRQWYRTQVFEWLLTGGRKET